MNGDVGRNKISSDILRFTLVLCSRQLWVTTVQTICFMNRQYTRLGWSRAMEISVYFVVQCGQVFKMQQKVNHIIHEAEHQWEAARVVSSKDKAHNKRRLARFYVSFQILSKDFPSSRSIYKHFCEAYYVQHSYQMWKPVQEDKEGSRLI